jgi:hypothetical protein
VQSRSCHAQKCIGELVLDTHKFLQLCKVHVLEIADFHGKLPFRLIRISETSGNGTAKRDAGHPEPVFAQRDPGSVCSSEFNFL